MVRRFLRSSLPWLLAVLVGCGPAGSGTTAAIGGVTVTPPTSTISVGAEVQLTATPTGVVGSPVQTVTWTASPPGVVTVSTGGKVTGEASGTATVTATSVFDTSKSGSATVVVTDGGSGAGGTVLLVPNFLGSKIEVLATAGALADLTYGTPLNSVPFPTAAAVGPDGRVYVASVSGNPGQDPDDPYDDAAIVIYPAAALAGGTVAPVAHLTSSQLGNPFALAFDGDGTLWVGNTWQDPDDRNPLAASFRYVALLAFRDVASIVADDLRDPDVVLALRVALDVEPWGIQIRSLFLDAGGNLWVTDGNSVTRIDDVAGIADGAYLDYEPDLQIRRQFSVPATPADGNIDAPWAAAVTADGTLYVANAGNGVVGRFDDAPALTDWTVQQPDGRFLVQGVALPSLMALDPEGALWFGAGASNAFVRVVNPAGVAEKATAVPATSRPFPPGFAGMVESGIAFFALP